MVTSDPKTQRAIEAQAAAWLARLQGQHSGPVTTSAFRSWFDADEAHRVAFERATEIWDILPGAAALDDVQLPVKKPGLRRMELIAMAASILAVIGAGIGYVHMNHADPVYATAVGRQENVVLPDGSRIELNSDSQVTVQYSSGERQLRLDRGEVMFHVRKDPKRPFTVASADERVRALGTAFVVRRFPLKTVVTLTHGRVEISRASGWRQLRLAVLRPGERATLTGATGVVIDRPPVDMLTAWRNGQVIFDNTSLLEAASEMNRYAVSKRVVMDPSVAGLRISGIFGIDELEQFALSAAALHQLTIERQGNRIRLVPGTLQSVPNHAS